MTSSYDISKDDWNRLLNTIHEHDRCTLCSPRKYDGRDIFNAILYMAHNPAASWRNIPYRVVPWRTVRLYCQKWSDLGLFERVEPYVREIHPNPPKILDIWKIKQGS